MPKTTLKNSQVVNAIQVVGILANNPDIPVHLKWGASQLLKHLRPIFEDIGKAESEIVKIYAELDTDGNIIPDVDATGKPRQHSWKFKGAAPQDATADERTLATAACAASAKAFGVTMQELFGAMASEIAHDTFALEVFEKSGLTGNQLDVIEFLIKVPTAE